MHPGAGSVLVVCTGNVCRSPYIALSLADRLRQYGVESILVESAGIQAMKGAPAAPAIVEALWEQGVDATGFRAQQLTRDQIDGAGLIVAASREHRSAVAKMRPRALSRLFTLRQLARLLEASAAPGDVQDPVGAVAARGARMRGRLSPSAGVDDDVPDPWGRDENDYLKSVERMAPAVEVLARALSRRDTAR